MKPHEAIFRAAIESFDLDPARTLYIDDLADNIAAGRRLGFVCHHYSPKRHEDFELTLKNWLGE
jgi:HAD superfamily hydrolase (TIGR01509 family)